MIYYLFCYQGYGEFQSIGGNGNGNGGAGSGGRISMEFSQNKTFTGQFDTYGGLGQNNGSPGTSFFHHKGISNMMIDIDLSCLFASNNVMPTIVRGVKLFAGKVFVG